MSPMASMELAVVITVPLAVLLVALLLTVYFVYRWSCCCKTRGGANCWSFCKAVGAADNWSCCATRDREGNDGESSNTLSDFVTPEAIIPEGNYCYSNLQKGVLYTHPMFQL